MRVGRPIVGAAKAMLDAFVESLAEEHGITVGQLMRIDRHPAASRARFHAYHIVKCSTGLSYPEIGAYFGVDHTTIIYGDRKWEALLNGDKDPAGKSRGPRADVVDLLDEAQSDETQSDETQSDETQSDETQSEETQSEETESDEDSSTVRIKESG